MDEFGTRLDATTVQFVRLLPGPIEKIWDYIADGKKRGEWFTTGELPAKVGERFEMRFRHGDYSPHKAPPPPGFETIDRDGKTMSSILLALEPPHRLAFSFGNSVERSQYSEVDIRLTPEAGGKVRLTLTHSKLRDRDQALNVSGGWHSHLAMLQYKAQGQVPPAFWDEWRKTEGVYEKRYI